MAHIYEEEIKITLSIIIKDNDNKDNPTLMTDDQKEILVSAVEGILDDPAVVVEIL